MKKLYFIFCLFPLGILAQSPVDLSITTKKYNDVKLTASAGVYDITTTGKDPYVFTSALKTALNKENTYLSFEYFCPTGVDFIQVYFYPLREGKKPVTVRDVGSTEGWVEFKIDISDQLKNWGKKGDYLRLDFGSAPDLKIQLRNLNIRPQTEREKEIQAQKVEKKKQETVLKKNLKNYLAETYQNKVDRVLVTNDSIEISGEVNDSHDLFLAEVSPYENVTQLKDFEFKIPIKQQGNRFKINLNRTVKRHNFKQDRVLSKWVVVKKNDEGYSLASHARYADSIVPKYNYPFVKPATKKGLGGYSAGRDAPVSDLDDLGITSVTVNIWVNKFLRSKASAKNRPFQYMGKTYYINKKAVENLDKTLRSTAKRNIEVSAILLVDKASKSPDKVIGKILQHPDCDPAGIYSMPNVTSPIGVQYYAAILDFLAARYSRPDKKHGRINHWIIHNEVDAGWVWTNAGDKEALVFMNLYLKSMRMSYNIARKYNPNSKVFISLTHYWNWTSNPHFYHSKKLLGQLLEFSKAEGDFEWAIAQHPYPESLREPKTWLDKKVSFDFDTKLITFKNLEVLNAWVKQPKALYKGKYKRTVYLSENGTNSPTYSEKDLKEQAAGLAYALKKIKYLDGIDGFQYHNWQDSRGEGGLRIGLRRFPDAKKDPGGEKPAWYVYQAFGTSKEDAVFDPYKKMIGIDNWDEIRHKGKITGKKKAQALRKIHSGTWEATDALGRSLPGYAECGPVKKNRYVGIFYFITHNKSDVPGPFNVTEILKKNPKNPKWGKGSHYWGEPEIGYYLNTEEWAIRKHAYQLSDAGVDVIIMDVTNNNTYPETYLTICKVFEKMRKEGEQTPAIAFLGSEVSVNKLWKEFYSKGRYKDLWFQWKGKPLLLYGQHETPDRHLVNDIKFSKEIQDFFNLKQSWAWTSLPWYDQKGKDEWPWLDHYPQAVSWHDDPSEAEMLPVSVAQHPLSNIGRSFHNFHQPKTNEYDLTPVSGKGLYFQEQWKRALIIDPEFVFVTGWNEWSAGRQTMGENVSQELQKWKFYPGAQLGKVGKPLKPGDVYFIDQYNQEYSRDIEPMKGGHTDNYYYQLMANIRRYKGVNPPIKAGAQKTIAISGDFDQWKDVENVYEDHLGDTAHRHSKKQGNAGPYINTLGRNDISETRLARDKKQVYFYVKTKDPLTEFSGKNWMVLLLDTDQDKTTGWEGYDLMINRDVKNAKTTPVKRYDSKKGWVKVDDVPYNMQGNQLMLAIPKKMIQAGDSLNFNFHWVDDPKKLEDITDFFTAGDNAPSRRANYRYETN